MFEIGDSVKFRCRHTSGRGIIVDDGTKHPAIRGEGFKYAVQRTDGGDLSYFYFDDQIRFFREEELEHTTKFYIPEQTGDTDEDI